MGRYLSEGFTAGLGNTTAAMSRTTAYLALGADQSLIANRFDQRSVRFLSQIPRISRGATSEG